MGQIYKIYLNRQAIFLAGTDAVQPDVDQIIHMVYWDGQKKSLKSQFASLLLDPQRSVWIWHEDVEILRAKFFDQFKILEAAGGWVSNLEGKMLVFFRRGVWDLPKGKIDPGETPEEAAVREVQEETGLKRVELGPFLLFTYHLYRLKENWILKKTWWYRMATPDTHLVPQVEEDISEILWVSPENCMKGVYEVYDSLKDVVLSGMRTQFPENK